MDSPSEPLQTSDQLNLQADAGLVVGLERDSRRVSADVAVGAVAGATMPTAAIIPARTGHRRVFTSRRLRRPAQTARGQCHGNSASVGQAIDHPVDAGAIAPSRTAPRWPGTSAEPEATHYRQGCHGRLGGDRHPVSPYETRALSMFESSAVLTCDAELEAVVGARPGAVMLKSIRFLDEHCERFLANSPFAVIGTTTGDGALQTLALGGEPGLAVPRSDTVLDLGAASGNDVLDGAPASLIALIPGYGETLRVNGRLRVSNNLATLDVEEALLHCAKAIMRSELWAAPGTPEPPDDRAVPTVAAFLADAPFVVLVSTDADGHTDVSPKGDPPGLIHQIDDCTIALADRPGNRRTDTLHNLMDDPRIALLAMKPGSRHVAEIRGSAPSAPTPHSSSRCAFATGHRRLRSSSMSDTASFATSPP